MSLWIIVFDSTLCFNESKEFWGINSAGFLEIPFTVLLVFKERSFSFLFLLNFCFYF